MPTRGPAPSRARVPWCRNPSAAVLAASRVPLPVRETCEAGNCMGRSKGVCCCCGSRFGAEPARTRPLRGTPVSGLCVPISAAGLQARWCETRCGVRQADATVGSKRPDVPVRVGLRGGGDFSPVSPLAESLDRLVSGTSVERARLHGRGSSGSLYRRSSLAS
ncbi:hypothetical protein O3P69_008069 [Scylla paramamosain]|uniref:Uncharacterized protein n=1 Tax=Scylla paramamosain TaxID=85552 RepID=A0AAW0T1Z3_SCYPA